MGSKSVTSAIDTSKPTTGTALTADVRANFAVAAAEISALQVSQATITENLFSNFSLAFSVSGNALTIAAKTATGVDPSAASPVPIAFRSASAAAADYTVVSLVAPTSLIISSGSTLGTANSPPSDIPFRLWIVAFNDGGTVRLGVINCYDPSVQPFALYPLAGWGIASSTAEGGAGVANSAQVFYTASAVASKPYTVLGYATWETGLASLGAWNIVPTRAQLFGPGVLLPGQTVQMARYVNAGVGTAVNSIIPYDNTSPEFAEGTQTMPTPFQAKSAANLVTVEVQVNVSSSVVGSVITATIFSSSDTNATLSTGIVQGAANEIYTLRLFRLQRYGTTAGVTISSHVGTDINATLTLNGAGGAGKYGGSYQSFLEVRELMS